MLNKGNRRELAVAMLTILILAAVLFCSLPLTGLTASPASNPVFDPARNLATKVNDDTRTIWQLSPAIPVDRVGDAHAASPGEHSEEVGIHWSKTSTSPSPPGWADWVSGLQQVATPTVVIGPGWQGSPQALKALKQELDERGYDVRVVDTLDPNGGPMENADKIIEYLRNEAEAGQRIDTSNAIYVGISRGGLDARAYNHKYPKMAFEGIVTVGTPHLGSAWADLGWAVLAGLGGREGQKGAEGMSIDDLTSGYAKSFYPEDQAATNIRTIVGNGGKHFNWLFGGEYDGAVSRRSAEGFWRDSARYVEGGTHDNDPETGLWGGKAPQTAEKIDEAIKEIIQKPQSAGQKRKPLSTLAENLQLYSVGYALLTHSIIYPDTVNIHSLSIHENVDEANFVLSWLGGDLSLILHTPDGRVIDPVVAAGDPTIEYLSSGGFGVLLKQYTIQNPAPGNWTVEITAIDVPANGLGYLVSAGLKSELSFSISFSKDVYDFGEPITVEAILAEHNIPIVGATVTGQATMPDGTIELHTFLDDGSHGDIKANDGIYTLSLSAGVPVGGPYQFLAAAYGRMIGVPIAGGTAKSVRGALPEDVDYQADFKQFARGAIKSVWVRQPPDLSISSSDLAFSNSNPLHGDPVTINATIHNLGDQDAVNATVLFSDGPLTTIDALIGEAVVNVPAGESTVASVVWTAKYGDHQIHVQVNCSVLERDYTNNEAARSIDVIDLAPPIADAGPDQTVTGRTTVYFDGSNSTDNVGITSYSWDFNNDGIEDAIGANPALVGGYDAPGTYVVTLTVDDAAGNGPVTDAMTVTVIPAPDTEPPTAEAGPDQIVTEDSSVSFDGRGSSDNFGVRNYFWDINISVDSDNDGVPDNDTDLVGSHPDFAGYTESGTYTVQLTVDDAAGNGPVKDTLVVTVENVPPVADAGPDQTVGCGPVTFDGSGSQDTPSDLPSLTYSWDFGDETTETGKYAIHIYAASGIYTVTLTVTDDDGALDTDMAGVTVECRPPEDTVPPTAIIAAPTANALIYDEVSVSGTATDENFKEYRIDAWTSLLTSTIPITDGVLATWDTTQVNDGAYTIKLTAIDTFGNVSSDVVLVTVDNQPKLQVNPIALNLNTQEDGDNPVPQDVLIANPDRGILDWTATKDASWLNINPVSGTAPSTLTVSVDITGLRSGTYTGTITITGTVPGTENSPQTITVNLCILFRDFDDDSKVTVADIMEVANRWRMTETDDDWDPWYDVNNDGIITIVDIMLVVVHWGETCE